jgi:hypothetical protein
VDEVCCAATTCSPSLRLCFRESQHPEDDTDSPCILSENRRTAQNFTTPGLNNAPIEEFYRVSIMTLPAFFLFASACMQVVNGSITSVGSREGNECDRVFYSGPLQILDPTLCS